MCAFKSLTCLWLLWISHLWLLTGAKMAGVVAKREGPQFISEVAVRGNAAVLDYCRTSVSALSGATAGILGLTGLYGFIFYFMSAFLLSLLLILKAGRRWNKFFKSRRLLFTGGLVGGLFTYVLFWTFLYGMVHVYWVILLQRLWNNSSNLC